MPRILRLFYEYGRYGGITVQSILPDITVEVIQEKIVSALDLVGFNKIFLCGDFDKTVQRINTKIYK